MDFASNYVLNYNISDDECVSDEELEHGMTLSDSDEGETLYEDFQNRSNETVETDDSPSSSHVYDNVDRAPSGSHPPLGPPPIEPRARPPPPGEAPPPPVAPRPRPPPPGAPSQSLLSIGKGLFKKAFPTGTSSVESRDTKKMKKMPRKKSHWRSAPCRDARPAPENIGGKKWRRADTNIISIKFSTLIRPSQMHTGDPVYCTYCKGLLCHISHIETDGSDQVWMCEFCSNRNLVDVMPEEKPHDEDVTFMLEPALTTITAGRSGTDQSLIVFCVDVSGSMCVTTEVPGKLKLRGSSVLKRMQSFNEDRMDQHLPGERRNLTYVSRLQAMQAAVDFQIGEMAKEHPNRRAALITFNNEVNVIGDGSTTEITLAGDKLTQKDDLFRHASELPLPQPVSSSRKVLGEKVFGLEEGGSTALGPALVVAVAMASQSPGSKVIVCTDGMANVGLGNLDNYALDEKQLEESESFYTYLAETAKQKGVSISVISIKGTDCKLVELGRISDITGGQVNIVDPLKLTEEFGNIIANPVIATNVQATLILHKGLYVRHEETNESHVTKEIGNVTADTEITFEFGVRTPEVKPEFKMDTLKEADEKDSSIADDAEMAGASGGQSASVHMESLKELPFQIQIAYNDMDGNKALRLITKTRPVTNDRSLAEKEINVALVGAHTAQLASKFAMEGSYSKSRLTAFMNQRLVSRYSRKNSSSRPEYAAYVTQITPMERQIRQQQQSERIRYGTTHSDSEDDDSDSNDLSDEGAAVATDSLDGAQKPKKKGILAKMKKSRSRKSECSDEMATLNYAMRKFTSNKFKE